MGTETKMISLVMALGVPGHTTKCPFMNTYNSFLWAHSLSQYMSLFRACHKSGSAGFPMLCLVNSSSEAGSKITGGGMVRKRLKRCI